MKLSKFILAGAIATVFAASAQAGNTYKLTVTGATTFRGAFHRAVLAAFPTCAWNYDSATATTNGGNIPDNATYQVYVVSNYPNSGDTTKIYSSFLGSGSGIAAVDGGTVSVIDDSQVGLVTGAVSSGTNCTGKLIANVAPRVTFSDVFQNSTTSANLAALNDDIVGVVPFVWVSSKNAPAGLTNVTSQVATLLLGAGKATASQFTGDVNDGQTVYLVGRASSSGTRITTALENKYGLGNQKNYDIVRTTGTGVAGSGNTIGVTSAGSTAGNGGQGSNGASVQVLSNPMNTTWAANNALVSYIGYGDYTSSVRLLSYNGVEFSADAVYNGQYTHWGYEHAFKATNWNTGVTVPTTSIPEGNQGDVIWGAIKTQLSAALAAGTEPAGLSNDIDTPIMMVTRANDGTVVSGL